MSMLRDSLPLSTLSTTEKTPSAAAATVLLLHHDSMTSFVFLILLHNSCHTTAAVAAVRITVGIPAKAISFHNKCGIINTYSVKKTKICITISEFHCIAAKMLLNYFYQMLTIFMLLKFRVVLVQLSLQLLLTFFY